MIRKLSTAILLVLLSINAPLLYAEDTAAPSVSEIEQELHMKELVIDHINQFTLACKHADITFLENFLAKNILFNDPIGSKVSKKTILNNIKTKEWLYETLHTESLFCSFFEDTVVVIGTLNVKAWGSHKQVLGLYQLFAVLKEKDGSWQLIAWNTYPIAKTQQAHKE